MKDTDLKKEERLAAQEAERLELLQKSNESKGKQLRIDIDSGSLSEFDEIKELIGRNFDDPEEKYNLYYKGIRRVLLTYLPKGSEWKEARDLIYDEKNIFLNRGKKKSDNDGVRKSDGRMTYQPIMNEMLDVIIKWVSESQNPTDLYQTLYDLNDKHQYGHEDYDKTAIKVKKALARLNSK